MFFTYFDILEPLVIASNVGSVVECSPATRAARVRFPDVACTQLFLKDKLRCKSLCFAKGVGETYSNLIAAMTKGICKKKVLEMRGIDPRTSHMLSERSTIWATSPVMCKECTCTNITVKNAETERRSGLNYLVVFLNWFGILPSIAQLVERWTVAGN